MTGPEVRAAAGGATLAVRVAPGARRDRIAGVFGRALKVSVAAPPEKGRANEALVDLLAGALGAAAKDLAILRGAASRDKVVLFRGWSADALRERVAGLLP